MKKAFCILLFLVLTGCFYGKIKVIKDDFKNLHVLKMDMYNESRNRNIEKHQMYSTFTRIIDEKGNEKYDIKIKIILVSTDNPLTKSVFLKIDDVKHEFTLKDLNASSKSSSSTATNPTTGKTETYSSRWEEHSGQIDFSKDIKTRINNCSSFMIRVYAGDVPYDFYFSKGQLSKIKELFNYDINAK